MPPLPPFRLPSVCGRVVRAAVRLVEAFKSRARATLRHSIAPPGAAWSDMAAHNDFGRAGEDRAVRLLERRGWTILHRNWRWHRKEIDIVARRGAIVAFVEVKARRSATLGHPLEAVTARKRRELEAAAHGWILRHGAARDCYRFDAVWLLGSADGGEVRHVEGAWTL